MENICMKHYNVEMKENNSISKLLKLIKPSSRVLEFGCANGHMTQYMREELKCSVCIVEYDKESFNIAIKYASDGICSDIMNFEWLTAFHEKFDYIIFADVLEHLSDPGKVIKSCRDVLKDEGSLLVSVPNIGHNDILIKLIQQKFEYTEIGLLDNTHIHFFAYDGIKKFFNDEGFAITQFDYTLIEMGCTEQFNRGMIPFQISTPVLNKLQERESGEIYQFVICAQKSEFVQKESEYEYEIPKPCKEGKIYFDRKNGFNEDEVQHVNAINIGEGKYRCECTISDLKNVTALRYDPIEGQNCIITKCCIKQGDKELQVEYSSNLSGNTGVILLGPDPLVVARTDDDKNEISLQIEYIVESDAFIEEVLHNFQDKQNDYLKSNYDAGILKNQLDEANRRIVECTSERNEIVSILQTSLDDCRNERNRTVSELQISLDDCRNERDRIVSALQISLDECRNEKDRIASALQASLDDCRNREENIKLLESEIETIRKEKEVLYLDAQSVSDMKDRQIEILNRELQKKKDDSEEIARYKDRCSFLEARINKIEHTMSWRITKGLRFLGNKLQIK